MKRKIAMLVSLVFVLGLFSCSSAPGNTSQQGNGDIELCETWTTDGYYYTDEVVPGTSTLIYIDFETKQEIALCSRPECLHMDETCNALFANGIGNVFVLNNSLFSMQGTGDNNESALVQSELNGSNPHIRVQLPANYTMFSEFYYSDGNKIYFTVSEVVQSEENTPESRTVFLSVDIDTWQYEVLHQFPVDNTWYSPEGVLGRRFIWATMLDDQNGEVYVKFEWFDVDTGIFEEIKTIPPNMGASIHGEYFYEQDFEKKTIVRTHLLTNVSETYDYSDFYAQQDFTGEIIQWFDIYAKEYWVLSIIEMGEEGSTFNEYIWDYQSGEIIPFTLFQTFSTSQHVPILADLGDTLLVRPDWIVENKTINGYTNPTYSPIHAFISKQDYFQSLPNYEYVPSFRVDNMPG